jgi:hypothetical protein
MNTYNFITAIAGDPNAVLDWRAIHDRDRSLPAAVIRGTLSDCWDWLVGYNQAGYGIFCTISALDGHGRTLEHVSYARAHYIDLDHAGALEAYQAARAHIPTPSFGVQSSPGKFHLYWSINPYKDNDRFSAVQSRLATMYGGDVKVKDATRVMRVPGFYHCKQDPYLVPCERLDGFGHFHSVDALEASVAHVQSSVTGVSNDRHALGDPELAAPSLADLVESLTYVDPNGLSRDEWISMTAAIKQSGWTLTDPDTLMGIWMTWCARYTKNDVGENIKQWNSLKNTQLGWSSIVRRVPEIHCKKWFGNDESFGEFLDVHDQKKYFKDCNYIVKYKSILTPSGRLLDSGAFNAVYGGKYFTINSQGKTTDEPWKAATRGTQWQLPKIDTIRFLPHKPHLSIHTDELGRTAINTYRPAKIIRKRGDPSPWLNHLNRMIGNDADAKILLEYLAHNIKYPGFKIPWAPVIQSAEGVGKTVAIKKPLVYAIGRSYVYEPSARDLAQSGAKFNGWMRNKLLIIADEIKCDDRRDLIEVLKPMITEEVIEVESKGVDKDIEDNYSNWIFFTNWKDAVPVTKNGRRFAIFYSPFQTHDDLIVAGMDDAYFGRIGNWLDEGGCAIVADYLMNYPIERGMIPRRAPYTTSTQAAIEQTRSPVERLIAEAVDDNREGFRGGWVSIQSVIRLNRAVGATRGNLTASVVKTVLESMGYKDMGRTSLTHWQDDVSSKSHVFHINGNADVARFGLDQGWPDGV